MRWRQRGDGAEKLDREVAFHLDELTRANLEAGMPAEEARRQARIAFGGAEQVKQQVRAVHTTAWAEAAAAHARAAVRFVRKAPGFSLAVVLTLGLGIGANTAVFSAIDAVLLRPLGFPHGDRLVALHQREALGGAPDSIVAPPRLEDWRRLNQTFDALGGYYTQDISEIGGALPERLEEAVVAPRFLDVWGVRPELGRDFTAAEEQVGGPDAVLISDRLWRRKYAGSPDVLGQRVRVAGASSTIVGVMPRSFLFSEREVEVWAPQPVDAPYAQSREATWYRVVGRLKPGVTLRQARADLQTVQGQLGRQYPRTDRDLRVTMEPLKGEVVGRVGGSLWLLYGSVTLLLLIACTNIAALLLARTSQREHEIAVRFALGASRAAIVGQLLSETLGLALLGAGLGLAMAAGAIRGIHRFGEVLPRAEEIGLDWRILLYTLGSALAAALVCGLLPAMRGGRKELARSLARSSRTQAAGTRVGLQWALVSTQVAFAVTLLIGAGLLLRSFEKLGRVDPGFDPGHVAVLQVSGSWGETAKTGALTQRVERTLNALRGAPGVEAAATTAALPGVGGQAAEAFKLVEGQRDVGRALMAEQRFVSEGYLQTVRLSLLRGEGCRAGPVQTLLVNRSFAQRYLGPEGGLGRHLQIGDVGQFVSEGEIRGVVGDARENGLEREPGPTVYWCVSAPNPMAFYLVRTRGDAAAMVETLRRTVHGVEPGRAVYGVGLLADKVEGVQAENRLRTALLSGFAGTAVSLACVGLYGTLSYLGRVRQKEMGLRLAMGASRRQIAERFFVQGLRVVGTGCGVGVLLGWAGSRLLAGMLYGVTGSDPVTYAGVVGLVAFVGLLASLRPALRAAWTNPAEVLREE